MLSLDIARGLRNAVILSHDTSFCMWVRSKVPGHCLVSYCMPRSLGEIFKKGPLDWCELFMRSWDKPSRFAIIVSRMAVLTNGQAISLTSISVLSSLLSITCSSIILYFIRRRQKEGSLPQNTTYHRLLFGLSVMDIINSATFMLQPVLAPKSSNGGDSENVVSHGNDATCTLVGFLAQFGIAAILYNGMLNCNFMLIICFGYEPSQLARQVEPWMHGVAILWPLLTGIAMIPMEVYEQIEIGLGCYVVANPSSCTDGTQLACYSQLFGWAFGGGPLFLVVFFLLISNIMIYCKVRLAVKRSSRYEIAGRELKKTRQVASQATLYVVACFNTVVWQLSIRGVESLELVTKEDESEFFWLMVLVSTFYPLQGFWNLLIYVRPKYMRFRCRYPRYSRRACLWKALTEIDYAMPSMELRASDANAAVQRVATPMALGRGVSDRNVGELVGAEYEIGSSRLAGVIKSSTEDICEETEEEKAEMKVEESENTHSTIPDNPNTYF